MSRFALLNLGFRPFFLGAGLFSAASICIWFVVYTAGINVSFNTIPPTWWHAHEMIFGYTLAVIGGFLLTAVKNWTGIQTLKGVPLLLLFSLWLLPRVLFFIPHAIPVTLIAVIDILFVVLLIISLLFPIIKVKQWKQLVIIAILSLILVANVLFYLGIMNIVDGGERLGLYAGLYLIMAYILVIIRRVFPFFAQKGLGESVKINNYQWVDIPILPLLLIFIIIDMINPLNLSLGLVSLALFVLCVARLIGWHTPGLWRHPLLWVLYMGHVFIAVGFALKAASIFWSVSPFLSVHAFGFGAIGMITMGMMSRVAWGHTGRNMATPPKSLFWIFCFLLVGAILRVLIPLLDQLNYALWIGLSQALWILSFTIFLWTYIPILLRPRVDGQDG